MTSTPDPNGTARLSQASARSVRAWAVLLGVTFASVLFDLWTKALAFRSVAGAPVEVRRSDVLAAGPGKLHFLIPPHDAKHVIDNLLDFTLVLNPGAVFGIGAGKRWFFVAFTIFACLGGVLLFVRWTTRAQWWAHAAIGLILGGGLGNLYDRMTFACVRDFIHPLPGVKLPFGWTWPWGGRDVWPYVSNVADALLIVGVVVLAIKSLREPSRR